MEVGGARTVFASLMSTHFLKWLFIQSEAESGKFGEVSRVLHFAVRCNSSICFKINTVFLGGTIYNTPSIAM